MFNAIKCAYFKYLSTTTKIASAPCEVDNPVMKSIAMSSQTLIGIRRGHNKPAGESVYIYTFGIQGIQIQISAPSSSLPKEIGCPSLISSECTRVPPVGVE